MSYRLLILPGDGIGPEIMEAAKRVLGWFGKNRGFDYTTDEDLVGGISYETHGEPATDAMMAKALAADAVLFGSVGGPGWDKLPFAKKPEQGLLRLRGDLKLFAAKLGTELPGVPCRGWSSDVRVDVNSIRKLVDQ